MVLDRFRERLIPPASVYLYRRDWPICSPLRRASTKFFACEHAHLIRTPVCFHRIGRLSRFFLAATTKIARDEEVWAHGRKGFGVHAGALRPPRGRQASGGHHGHGGASRSQTETMKTLVAVLRQYRPILTLKGSAHLTLSQRTVAARQELFTAVSFVQVDDRCLCC